MVKINQITDLSKKIFSILTYKQRIGLFYLFLLMIIGSLFELIGIGLVIPLLNLIANESNSSNFFILNYFYEKYENAQFEVHLSPQRLAKEPRGHLRTLHGQFVFLRTLQDTSGDFYDSFFKDFFQELIRSEDTSGHFRTP